MSVPAIFRRRRLQYGGGAAPAFSPSTLFASGEEGAWYEPSTTTAFRSTTDLTPCGYGQSAGFLLDLSKGAGYSGGSFTGLGSELVTNGTFDTDVSGWTASSGKTIAWSSGELLMSVDYPTSGGAVQTLTTEVGKTYYFSCTARRSAGTNTGVLFQVRSSATWPGSFLAGAETTSATNETISFAYVATSTTTYLWLAGGTDVEGYFDNISVRELPGNHATQGTESARPILARVPSGGRRNLLERTEEFDNAYWTKLGLLAFGSGSVANTTATTDPLGGNTAELIVPNTSNTTHAVIKNPSGLSLIQYTISVYAKAGGYNWFLLANNQDGGVYVNLSDGSIGTVSAGFSNPTVTPVGNGWYRCSVTYTLSGSNRGIGIYVANGDGVVSFAGNGTSGIYIWGAQLEEGSSATAYQRVSSEYDITEAGVTSLEYLAFDGSDDGMATASIDFTATDKMSVFAGVEKESESQFGVIVENGTLSTNANTFMVQANATFGAVDWQSGSRGDAAFDVSGGQIATSNDLQPALVVLSGLHDISGDSSILRLNGAQVATGTGDKGAGNFANATLDIGARDNAASVFFDGKLFSLIVRGAASTAQEISDTETYLAAKTGVTIP